MSQVKKRSFYWLWTVRFIKTVCSLMGLAAIAAVIWWWMQPTIPSGPPPLRDEFIASDSFRDAADQSRDRIQSVAGEMGLPSVSIAVSVGGDLIWAAALGTIDLSSGRDADLRTLYRTGSVAKPMTGYAVAELVRREEIDIDQTIHDFLPDYPEKRWAMTLRQLGSHTAGMRHYAEPGHPSFISEQFSKHHYQSVNEALSIFEDDPLLYEPESDFVYSTHGFTLLSAAMEVATDTSYPDLMKQLVWNPLEMSDTMLDDLTKAPENRATPYLAIRGRAFYAEGPDPSYKWAGGGLLSTPTDLVKVASAMIEREHVTHRDRKELFEPRPLADGRLNPQGYALGWRNETHTDLVASEEPVAVMHHGGQCPGGSSFLLLIPDGEVCAAVMTNVSVKNPWPMRESLFRIAGAFRNVSRMDAEPESSVDTAPIILGKASTNDLDSE